MKYILILITALIYPYFISGQVSLANSWTSTLNTHTVGAGTNRVLIYIIAFEDDDATNDVTAVTYGGQSMNLAVESFIITGTELQRVEIWYLRETEIIAAGSSTFIPTFSISSPFAGAHGYYTMAVTLQGVDQVTTICATENGFITGSTIVNMSTSLTVLPSEIFIYGTSGGQNSTHTPATGYTEGIDISGITGGQSATANHKLISVIGTENPTSVASNNQNRFVIAGIRVIPNGAACVLSLPIKLLEFNANSSNETVKLDWQTVSEINNDYFTLERSINGLDWESIKIINGAGNSNVLINYSTIDINPYYGISYYRLTQTDFDGEFQYSKIKSVNINRLENSFVETYPNPATNQITLEGNKTELEQITLYNVIGKNVTNLTKQIEINENKIIIDLSDLNKGIYYIKTKTTANKIYKK
ncbi:MAG: T9SS type A sorting domain-containing protein [Flavobacteriales bacterium]|nr:T9SS type A sorting domain-containing protein [Flavobacteriales bacterium]